MNRIARLFVIAAFLPNAATWASDDSEGIAFFEKRIRPVLVKQCYACHSSDANDLKGDLHLDSRNGILQGGSRGPAIVPGKPAESLLLKAIRHEKLEMPRKAPALSKEVVADFEKWIAMGAPDPREGEVVAAKGVDWDEARKYWAFQPVEEPNIPNVKIKEWPLGDLDRIVLAGIEAADLKPTKDADPATLLRRLSYDLIGLPPSPQDVREFVADYASDPQAAVSKTVDRLLASDQFGIHFGRYWLDVVRFRTRIDSMYRYRNYIIDSFNADKPYDRLVAEHLAGDLLVEKLPGGKLNPEPLIGTASLVLAVGGCDTVERQVELIGQTFMGMTMACARCHDHKFDPFTQHDYYALAGILQSSEMVGEKGGGIPLLKTEAEAAAHEADKAVELKLRKEYEKVRKEHPQAVQLAEIREQLERDDSDRQRERLKKLLEDQKKKGWDPNPPELARFPQLIRERREIFEKIRRVPVVAGMQEGKPVDVPVLRNGERSQAGEIAPRRFPIVLAGEKQKPIGDLTEGSGRLELARFVTSPENPLTARVMANRIWLWLMSEGIVRTPGDFGKTGDEPTDQRLLDYLAYRLVENEWSVKALVREIVLSRTYGLSSSAPKEMVEADLLNHRWARANLKRLRYEQIIDSLHAVAGSLELAPERRAVETRKPEKEPRLRTIYYSDGGEPAIFDGPDQDLLVDQRDASITAPQMLFFLNNGDVREMSRMIAKRVESAEDPIAELFLYCYGRHPEPDELAEAKVYIDENSLDRYCHALLCTNEFVYLK